MNLRTYLASAILACSALSVAQGAIIISDNFDGYADTTAFTTAWPVVSPQPTGTIVTDRFVSSPNSVRDRAVGTVSANADATESRSLSQGQSAPLVTSSFGASISTTALPAIRSATTLIYRMALLPVRAPRPN